MFREAGTFRGLTALVMICTNKTPTFLEVIIFFIPAHIPVLSPIDNPIIKCYCIPAIVAHMAFSTMRAGMNYTRYRQIILVRMLSCCKYIHVYMMIHYIFRHIASVFNTVTFFSEPCQRNYVFLKCSYFHWTNHCVLYQTLLPKVRSFQPYLTCQAVFKNIKTTPFRDSH